MGVCLSSEEKEQKKRNEEIEANLKQDQARMRNEVKMLLLGAHLSYSLELVFGMLQT